jgi:hypothetical protein
MKNGSVDDNAEPAMTQAVQCFAITPDYKTLK